MTLDLDAIRVLAAAATPGPWRSMRDGNQYIGTRYMPTAKCVGTSRVDGIVRPWNPHAYIAWGFPAEKFEVAQFLDADADFIAAAREAVPALCNAVERLTRERDEARVLVLRRLSGSDALTFEDAHEASVRWNAEKAGGS